MLYNEFKLFYLELEESVEQWGSTKLLMKTSLIEKEPGRLAEEEENSQVSVSNKKSHQLNIFFLLSMVATHFQIKLCITYLQVKRNNAMLCSTDN